MLICHHGYCSHGYGNDFDVSLVLLVVFVCVFLSAAISYVVEDFIAEAFHINVMKPLVL